MILVIKNGFVVATHDDSQLSVVPTLYPGCDIVPYARSVSLTDGNGNPVQVADPRTADEKRLFYRAQRAQNYPSLGDQLDLMWHAIYALPDGDPTKVLFMLWMDAIVTVKTRFPKT